MVKGISLISGDPGLVMVFSLIYDLSALDIKLKSMVNVLLAREGGRSAILSIYDYRTGTYLVASNV